MEASPPPLQYLHLALNFGTLLPPEMPTSPKPQLRAPQQAPQRADPGRPQGWRFKHIPLGLQVLLSAGNAPHCTSGMPGGASALGALEASPGARPPLLAPLPSEHLLFSFGEMWRTEEPAVLHGSLHGGCSPWGRSDSATKQPTVGFSVSAGHGVPKVLTSDAVHSGDSRRQDANSGEPPGQPTACALHGTEPERGRHPNPAPRAIQPWVHKDTAPGPACETVSSQNLSKSTK